MFWIGILKTLPFTEVGGGVDFVLLPPPPYNSRAMSSAALIDPPTNMNCFSESVGGFRQVSEVGKTCCVGRGISDLLTPLHPMWLI